MREYEWYQNLADEACAMPGSFAVFALGLEGEQWAPLVAEYLDLRRRALLPAREIPSCLDPEVWFPNMDTGRIGTGRIVYAVAEACQGIPGHRLAEPALGHLGLVLRKRRHQGHQVGTEGTEREIPASICVRRTP